MEEKNLTNYKLELKSKMDRSNINSLSLHKSQIILLFNLYDNQLLHEKFLEQIFENLIEDMQLIRYDFQKKIYSLYQILTNLSFICLLLKYLRYQKLIFDNFTFLKIYLKTISQLINSKFSLLFLILRKRFRYLKTRLYKRYKSIKYMLFSLYKLIVFNYLYCNFLMEKNLSSENYKNFYNS